MSNPNTSLFEGELIRFAPRDPERDAEVESQWTHDPDYWAMTEMAAARPLSPGQIKKKYADAEKEKNQFIFAVRTHRDDRLVGVVKLTRVQWTHGVATLSIGIGNASDRGQGYGADALNLILNYAFHELNLFRLHADTFEYNPRAITFLERAGFVVEVRRREVLHRAGRRWDVITLGLLRGEWSRVKREA